MLKVGKSYGVNNNNNNTLDIRNSSVAAQKMNFCNKGFFSK